MSGLEICLVIIGLILVACSFLFSEHLASDDTNKGTAIGINVAGVTEEVVKREVEAEVANIIDDRLNDMEIKIEKMTSEKLMAMGEFSEDIQKRISQNHEEVMFLYNMLNDKEDVLKNTIRDIENVKKSVKNMAIAKDTNTDAEDDRKKAGKAESQSQMKESEKFNKMTDKTSDMSISGEKEMPKPAQQAQKLAETAVSKKEKAKRKNKLSNNNERILELYSKGKTDVEIAKELGIGIGEVRLVIDLFDAR